MLLRSLWSTIACGGKLLAGLVLCSQAVIVMHESSTLLVSFLFVVVHEGLLRVGIRRLISLHYPECGPSDAVCVCLWTLTLEHCSA